MKVSIHKLCTYNEAKLNTQTSHCKQVVHKKQSFGTRVIHQ